MIPSLGEIFSACAILGCIYLLVALAVVLFWNSSADASENAAPEPVTILKPLHGAEPRLLECLTSFCDQDYGAPTQIVLGLQDKNDPAMQTASKLRAARPQAAIDVIVDPTSHGTNAKVSNLINMEAAAANDILIASDCDILVKPDHVARVVTLLQKSGVGVVTVLYHGEAAGPLWSKLAAHCINTHFLPNVLVGLTFDLAKPCFGSTIALRRQMLGQIGGFKAFANHLADDFAIGEAVRKAGHALEVAPFSVAHICHEETMRDILQHQLRWARTIKSIDMPGYLGSFIAHPFALAVLGIVAGYGYCIPIAAAALGLRAALCKAIERSFRLAPQVYWLIPFADLLSFSIFVWSFLGTAVSWKGSDFDVLDDGTLAQRPEG
ncbi:MAG TPA: bacteriohopanetetrol glucosamine biosynthesis glycosyltransferase HpnI [Hyphomicrobiales bacterium]|nr:bacteriohopanetetrol glucosamine biosynthesis glycosyltransferase HpnI [Hyphomicrobiales bacterium]